MTLSSPLLILVLFRGSLVGTQTFTALDYANDETNRRCHRNYTQAEM